MISLSKWILWYSRLVKNERGGRLGQRARQSALDVTNRRCDEPAGFTGLIEDHIEQTYVEARISMAEVLLKGHGEEAQRENERANISAKSAMGRANSVTGLTPMMKMTMCKRCSHWTVDIWKWIFLPQTLDKFPGEAKLRTMTIECLHSCNTSPRPCS